VDALVANLGSLGEHAREAGVRLLVENHVLAAFNLERFDENPLLMADPDEIELVIAELGGNVGLLMDVGHLKVSSHTLGFDLPEAMARLLPLAEGFHLSENGGMADDHLSFGDDAWFLPHLVGRQDFMTIEVHSTRFEDSVSAAIATRDFLQNGAPDA
jgi:sugar phosphate isomerase/epimerase